MEMVTGECGEEPTAAMAGAETPDARAGWRMKKSRTL
jgi:hypothetical protein